MADAVDPDFEDLFRPGPPAASAVVPERVVAEVAEVAEAVPAAPGSASPSGRLFRSQGVMEHPQAVLAIPIGSRLTSLARTSALPDDLSSSAAGDPYEDDEVPVLPAAERGTASSPAGPGVRERIVPVVSTVDSSRSADLPRPPEPAATATDPTTTGRTRPAADDGVDTGNVFGQRAVPGFVIWLVIGVLTLVAAFLNTLLGGGHLGWPTGAVLLATTIYCALIVRRSDLLLVIVAPPLVFLLAAATAGQIGVTGGGLVNRGAALFFALGDNWLWIVGSVVAAIALTVIRRSALRR